MGIQGESLYVAQKKLEKKRRHLEKLKYKKWHDKEHFGLKWTNG